MFLQKGPCLHTEVTVQGIERVYLTSEWTGNADHKPIEGCRANGIEYSEKNVSRYDHFHQSIRFYIIRYCKRNIRVKLFKICQELKIKL